MISAYRLAGFVGAAAISMVPATPLAAEKDNDSVKCPNAIWDKNKLNGSRGCLAKVRRSLSAIVTSENSTLTFQGDNSKNGSNADAIKESLDNLSAVYGKRAMKQTNWLSAATYTTLAGAAAVGGNPGAAYVVSLPIVLDRVEQYGGTRTLYSIGQDGLAYIRAYHRNIKIIANSVEKKVAERSYSYRSTCDNLRKLELQPNVEGPIKRDIAHINSVCEQLDVASIALAKFRAQLTVETDVGEKILSDALLCDVARFDRFLFERDEQARSGPAEALTDALSVVPTIIQSVVAREDLKLQQVGRLQSLVSGIILRTGNPTLRAMADATFPLLPNRMDPVSAQTIERFPFFSTFRDRLVTHISEVQSDISAAERLQAALKPTFLGYSVDAATSTVAIRRLEETGMSPNDLVGC